MYSLLGLLERLSSPGDVPARLHRARPPLPRRRSKIAIAAMMYKPQLGPSSSAWRGRSRRSSCCGAGRRRGRSARRCCVTASSASAWPPCSMRRGCRRFIDQAPDHRRAVGGGAEPSTPLLAGHRPCCSAAPRPASRCSWSAGSGLAALFRRAAATAGRSRWPCDRLTGHCSRGRRRRSHRPSPTAISPTFGPMLVLGAAGLADRREPMGLVCLGGHRADVARPAHPRRSRRKSNARSLFAASSRSSRGGDLVVSTQPEAAVAHRVLPA